MGEGGMGVVYRAFDSKLNRPVAIKFLSGDAADAAARRRFQQEARLASSLNHPHILTVHDIGEIEGRQYLVTEFVDVGTLATWLDAEPRSWRQVVELLTGVADAIAAAHEASILHRDIKPDNILISRQGYAKLADFGLASATAHTDHTRTSTGVIKGTVPYMSPEQASGQTLDVRSDIFSFGAVLYEALTGRRPFTGRTDLEILQQVTHAAPLPLGDAYPAALQEVVEKALEKDRAERYQSMREMVVDLRRLARKTDSAPALKPQVRTKIRMAVWLPWAIAAVVIAAVVVWSRFRPAARIDDLLSDARFTRVADLSGSERNPAVSPDGKFVAFVSDHDGKFDLWLSQTSSGTLQNLTKGSISDILGPVRNVGFTADGSDIWIAGKKGGRRLQLVPLVGGAPRDFLGATAAEVAWSPDGSRLVYHSFEDGDAMFVADGRGANVRTLLAAGPAGEHRHYPIFSQDGRSIFFTRGNPATREMDIWRIASDGGEPERLTHLNADIGYPSPIDARTVLFTSRDSNGAGPWLWSLDLETHASRRLSTGFEQYAELAATADGRRLVATVVHSQVSLWSVPILDHPATEHEIASYSVSTTRALAPRFGGRTLFYLSSRDGVDGLWSFRDGRASEIWKGSDEALLTPPAVSPDGGTVAIALRRSGKVQWHLLAADGTQLRPLNATVDARGTASWSPDGKWIVTGGSDDHGPGLFKLSVDGGTAVRLSTGPALDPVWSPTDDLIVYGGANVFTDVPLAAVRSDGTPMKLPAITLRRDGERVRFMPDGSGLVYMQNTTLAQDFWLLDLHTMALRPLTHLSDPSPMRTFDVQPDGKLIVFDRAKESSDIVLIDLAASRK